MEKVPDSPSYPPFIKLSVVSSITQCVLIMYKVNVPTFNLDKLENVKSAVEHVGLYVGLVIFTAAGAKVN